MRVQRPLAYKSLSEAIRPGVCPLCVFLKDVQSRCVHGVVIEDVESLCNFHAWAIAGAAPAATAAILFLRLLEQSLVGSNPSSVPGCSICDRITQEEVAILDELRQKLMQEKFQEWMRRHGGLCFPHAKVLHALVPEKIQTVVLEIVARERADLKRDLEALAEDASAKEKAHAGILGRVAESLVAQRGLNVHQVKERI